MTLTHARPGAPAAALEPPRVGEATFGLTDASRPVHDARVQPRAALPGLPSALGIYSEAIFAVALPRQHLDDCSEAIDFWTVHDYPARGGRLVRDADAASIR